MAYSQYFVMLGILAEVWGIEQLRGCKAAATGRL